MALTNQDLLAISGLLEDKLKSELQPMRAELESLGADVSELKCDMSQVLSELSWIADNYRNRFIDKKMKSLEILCEFPC